MSRQLILVAMLVALLMVVGSAAPGALAQDAEHPIVGAWRTASGGLLTIHADGTIDGLDPGGAVDVGAWQPTGERTADIMVLWPATPGGPTEPLAIARGSVEVAEDGTTFTATATIEFPMPDGGLSGQLGPVTETATRIAVEPMGEPVAPMPTFAAMPMPSPSPS